MRWNYADLSKAAKAAGGPEALTELLVQSGRNQMLPWLAGFTIIGAGAGFGIAKIVEFFQQRKRVSDHAVEAARQELIQGIKDYDATHSNDSTTEKEDGSC